MRTKEALPFWRDTTRQFNSDKYAIEINDTCTLVQLSRDGAVVLVPVGNVEHMQLDTTGVDIVKSVSAVTVVEQAPVMVDKKTRQRKPKE